MCTLTIHDDYESHSYIGRTTVFNETRLNTRFKAREMAISQFSSTMEPDGSTASSCTRTLDERFSDISSVSERISFMVPVKKIYNQGSSVLDNPLLPSREDENEDDGLDDVKIIKRTPQEEQIFKNELDKELEEYWAKRPEDLYNTFYFLGMPVKLSVSDEKYV
uniref:Uncharacterized protein n=1 Tax=Marseillevirus LCMAC101 TaxID=2506602 RepID=A0A481YRP0_9VIRU|nr:MAG: hypothetical protein LCMAC101_04660 [Marseillevirus LCMAC101]